jgi:hypothetical protein
MGDLFFNGMYSYIDPGTVGNINGTIAAADKVLSLADNRTKIVTGHGPLGNKADLTKSRDMLITSRDRIQKLKSTGKSAMEAVAEKPFADLDSAWGQGVTQIRMRGSNVLELEDFAIGLQLVTGSEGLLRQGLRG